MSEKLTEKEIIKTISIIEDWHLRACDDYKNCDMQESCEKCEINKDYLFLNNIINKILPF